GLPALRAPLGKEAAFDWERMVRALETETPFWTPGSRVGYHGITFGWLVGEVVRRIAGVSLGAYFRDQIAAPLELDFWIGLPAQHEPRVAPIEPLAASTTPRNEFERAVAEEPASIPALYLRNSGGWRPAGFNSRAGHAAEIGAAGGIAHARALARLYGCMACGGARGSYRLLREDTLAAAAEVTAATHLDATLLVPTRFGGGFMRQMDNRPRGLDSAVFGRGAFGHCGAGGSLAFAAPGHRLSFAYVMNRMGPGVLLNDRAHALVRACYDALGSSEGP
ncbi:MAG TPA: serine hydrolase domain-containing protein, partial [Ramlibacter sp.]|nr:serine hydrolase domain-containing protein [Ramlibacter sp.]